MSPRGKRARRPIKRPMKPIKPIIPTPKPGKPIPRPEPPTSFDPDSYAIWYYLDSAHGTSPFTSYTPSLFFTRSGSGIYIEMPLSGLSSKMKLHGIGIVYQNDPYHKKVYISRISLYRTWLTDGRKTPLLDMGDLRLDSVELTEFKIKMETDYSIEAPVSLYIEFAVEEFEGASVPFKIYGIKVMVKDI